MLFDIIYIALAVLNLALATLVWRHVSISADTRLPVLAWIFLTMLVLVGVADLLTGVLAADSRIVEVIDLVVIGLLAVLIYRSRSVAEAFSEMGRREQELREDRQRAMQDKYGGQF